jgi:prepilin-type N-terminal cleavage/methylation domain-containing protein
MRLARFLKKAGNMSSTRTTRFRSHTAAGFTMIEIMLVLALIGLIIIAYGKTPVAQGTWKSLNLSTWLGQTTRGY